MDFEKGDCDVDNWDDLSMIIETMRTCVGCENDTCPVKIILRSIDM